MKIIYYPDKTQLLFMVYYYQHLRIIFTAQIPICFDCPDAQGIFCQSFMSLFLAQRKIL